MAVFRVKKDSNYTVMSNFHLRDKRLSLKAKGLLSLMLSLPDDWDYSLSGLAVLSLDKIDSVRTGLLELQNYGYVILQRKRAAKGIYSGIEYIVYEKPQLEFPNMDKPILAKPAQSNTKKELNTNIIKKSRSGKFNDFEQHDYNFSELEKKLISN